MAIVSSDAGNGNPAHQERMTSITTSSGRLLDFSTPLVMGILNCTPDSFAVRAPNLDEALRQAQQLIDEGADIIDIGGESTRPGSLPVPVQVELERVIPVIEQVRTMTDKPLSIDTTKAIVAEKALTAGADIVNDISALDFDDAMAAVVAEAEAPVILMHIKGRPGTMQNNPRYTNVVKEVNSYFTSRVAFAEKKGIARDRLILDVGIGFGKRTIDNLNLVKNLRVFKHFDLPLMVGASRKRFIGDLTDEGPDRRIDGTLAVCAMAVLNGADIVRVHDVARTKRAIAMAAAVREA